MEKKIRWGILGTGRIAKIFCGMLRQLEQAELWAAGSRTKESAETFAADYGFRHSYGSYEELVQDPDVELIYVATPIGSHYEHVRLCLDNGKHVLCEKALTMKACEARELYELSRSRGLFLMEAMWTKCHPVFQKIIEWKREGKLGEIQGVEAKFYTSAASGHRLFLDKNQGGALYDLTIYPITYACAILGHDPLQLNAIAACGGDGIDTMESIQLIYGNNSFANLTGGLACDRQTSLYIHGTKGRIHIQEEHFFKAQSVQLINWENEVIDSFEEPFEINGYEYEAREAMECLRGEKTQSVMAPMEDTIDVIALLEECRCRFSALWETAPEV